MSLSNYKVGQYGGYYDHSDLVSANPVHGFPFQHTLNLYTYHAGGGTYYARTCKLCKFSPNQGQEQLYAATIYRKGDLNYTNQYAILDVFIIIWSSQSANYHFFCQERHGHANTSRFAFDSDGQVWFHNDGLWSQWTTVVVHKVSNISFAGTGESRNYHDHSSTYHAVNSGANHRRESSWGT
tara:strand:+ start:3088 stop:3633 length:546 start_codon:yes stop_codon:yes gene_type:complete